jgi:hypothetical protein
MSWSYEIRDRKREVICKAGGFATLTGAMAAAKAEVERLKRAGKVPATITAVQDSNRGAWAFMTE